MDVLGKSYQLHFLKIKGGRKIDFLLWPESPKDSSLMLEVKLSDQDVSPNFKLFSSHFPKTRKVQLVQNLTKKYVSEGGVEVRSAITWLADFKI